MIVSFFSKISSLNILTYLIRLKSFYHIAFQLVLIILSRFKLLSDASQLKQYFQYHYPRLKIDLEGDSSCVSCMYCENICPQDALKVTAPKMVSFPESLTVGEAPAEFKLDVEACIKCGLCSEVCYIQALEMTGKYETKEVDLVNLDRN